MIHSKTLIAPLLDFIFPSVCPSCKYKMVTYTQLCNQCTNQLDRKLEIHIQSGHQDFKHLTGRLYFDHAITFWKYSDELDRLVQLVKYKGKKRLGKTIGILAGIAFQQSDIDHMDMIIPVPLHKKRLSKRGYNQSEWIAMGLGIETGLLIRPELLKRTRPTKTQTKLDADQRQENVDNAFTVSNPQTIKGKSILVLDDVITTGATLNACAKVLKSCGAEKVIGIGLARPVTFSV